MPEEGNNGAMRSMEKMYKTAYKELTYSQIEKGTWRIFSQWEEEDHPSAIGKCYSSKIELLCDLNRVASECGL